MLDVIIPAYLPTEKHHSLLKRALRSLDSQTYKDFSVIIVLNGCYTDYETIKYSVEDLDLNLKISWIMITGKASGAIARNTGIKKSKAKYIAQLDADDQYHPDKLKKQIEFFEKNEKYSFVGTLAADWHGPKDIRDSCFKPGEYQEHQTIAQALCSQNVMCHGSIMFKRKDFLSLDGYNEKYKPGTIWPQYKGRMWEDLDLWKRAVQNGYKFYNIPERLYYWSVDTGVER